jgi:hypothetical protein
MILDNCEAEMFTGAIHILWGYTMSRIKKDGKIEGDPKLRKVVASLQEVLLCNAFMVDAMFELLVEKGILTGEEVRDRVKQLKEEAPPHVRWLQ